MTIYVTIGNSDDKLIQSRWASFYREVDRALVNACDALGGAGAVMHGRFVSEPTSPYQNACWSFTLPAEDPAERGTRDDLRLALGIAARRYGQDSIAWAEAEPEFIPPARRRSETEMP